MAHIALHILQALFGFALVVLLEELLEVFILDAHFFGGFRTIGFALRDKVCRLLEQLPFSFGFHRADVTTNHGGGQTKGHRNVLFGHSSVKQHPDSVLDVIGSGRKRASHIVAEGLADEDQIVASADHFALDLSEAVKQVRLDAVASVLQVEIRRDLDRREFDSCLDQTGQEKGVVLIKPLAHISVYLDVRNLNGHDLLAHC